MNEMLKIKQWMGPEANYYNELINLMSDCNDGLIN